jgi:hypothetical protein
VSVQRNTANQPVEFRFVDGPQADRVVQNDHEYMVLHANQNVRFEDPNEPNVYHLYRLHEDGTATWVRS